MKKVLFAMMAVAVALCSCGGGKSGGGSASGGEESSGGSLPDGKWPAAIYDKYGIPEIETKGRIVCTEFRDTDGPYQYQVYFNGVTKEEMQAYVKKLQEKGFRLPKYTQERIDGGRSDSDALIYLPGEKNDKRLRLQYDFERPMSFEYYEDEPNPAFEVVERDGEKLIEYNLSLSLNGLDNETGASGDVFGIKADEFLKLPNVRYAEANSNALQTNLSVGFFGDHQIAEGDFDAIHDGLVDLLAGKGAKFSHMMSGKDLSAEELKSSKTRLYNVEIDGKKYMMIYRSDNRVGDFGGAINYNWTISKK